MVKIKRKILSYNKKSRKKYRNKSRNKSRNNKSRKNKSKNKYKKSYINKILYGGAGGGHVDDRWRGICFRANKQKKH